MKSQTMYVGIHIDHTFYDALHIIFAVDGDEMSEEECMLLLKDEAECDVRRKNRLAQSLTRSSIGRRNKYTTWMTDDTEKVSTYELRITEKIT